MQFIYMQYKIRLPIFYIADLISFYYSFSIPYFLINRFFYTKIRVNNKKSRNFFLLYTKTLSDIGHNILTISGSAFKFTYSIKSFKPNLKPSFLSAYIKITKSPQ